MKTPVDVVGYGTQAFTRGGGPPQPVITLTRRFAPSELIQSNNRTSAEFIKLSANPGRGKGGTCFGDSGGPDVLGGTDIVLAVNSFVTNGNCAGVAFLEQSQSAGYPCLHHEVPRLDETSVPNRRRVVTVRFATLLILATDLPEPRARYDLRP